MVQKHLKDYQHNDSYHNNNQQNDTQHNGIQHNDGIIGTLSLRHYAVCPYVLMSF
jgi:hypothetical protein